MDIGIGLPNTLPGATGGQLTEWARRADAKGFSVLGTIDRVTYPNLEPLISLAAAAAVTERIRLATTILLAPPRKSTALLAKQAASIHKISGGRMVLGIAVGGREDDFEASKADFEGARRDVRAAAGRDQANLGGVGCVLGLAGAHRHRARRLRRASAADRRRPIDADLPPRRRVRRRLDHGRRDARTCSPRDARSSTAPGPRPGARASRMRCRSPTSRSATTRRPTPSLPRRLLRLAGRIRRPDRRQRRQGRRHGQGLHRGLRAGGLRRARVHPELLRSGAGRPAGGGSAVRRSEAKPSRAGRRGAVL